jgi:sterol O-acyltransferase
MDIRSNTEESLLLIRNRANRRKSLVIDNDYDESPEEDLEETKEIRLEWDAEEAPEIKELEHPEELNLDVHSVFHEINKTNPKRLNRRRTEINDPKYVSRFADVRFRGKSTTIFDAQSFKDSEVFGIYVLFWLGTAFLMMNNMVHYYFENSESIWNWPIVVILRTDILKVGATDLAMYLTTYFAYLIQYAVYKNWITWHRTGWILQTIYCAAHLQFWLVFASKLYMDFTWIAKVFLVLHNLVFLMKMHSYSFYNGYLWKVYRELQFSRKCLKRTTNGDATLTSPFDEEQTKTMLEESIAFCKFELEYQSMANPVSTEGTEVKKQELVKFPDNITLQNFFEYSMFPTVVYTLNYPRTETIRWGYVREKVIGIFGIIFLMVSVAQKWMYPLVIRCIEVRSMPIQERFVAYLFILLDMIPPFLMEYLFTFFLIWDAILNSIAELSRFADRDFYGPWWSCTDWSEFSRLWNIPVHKFLLRHVYHSSISAFNLNKIQAALVTFMISSIVHELVMYVIFGTLRGYLLLLQMSQIPLIMIGRTPFMRDKKVLGNVICWFGYISGPSMVCTLYLVY